MQFTASKVRRAVLLLAFLQFVSLAANFGTLVPIRGTAGDIALDERRNRLYITNLAAYRVEVLNLADRTLAPALTVAKPPSAVALSPDARYLVVGHFDNFPGSTQGGGYTVFDLDGGARQDVVISNPVLAIAFGNGSRALVITAGEALLLDPVTAIAEPLRLIPATTGALPVAFNTFPQKVTNATIGVSGDGNTIIALADATNANLFVRYKTGETTASAVIITASPTLGPRTVSVNADGSRFLAGWSLTDALYRNLAQFPYPTGDFRVGGHAFDDARDAIYADVPVSNTEAPVMHVVDTDNLTVRERIQLPQFMAGRSVWSTNRDTLYSVSDNGVLILPVASLARAPRVTASQSDLLFLGDACNRRVITQFVDIVDPNGGAVDFNLALGNSNGIRLSATSGTTPARIRVDVDPTAYQNAKGTTIVPINITSSRAVNIPEPVRLLINTRDVNQRGRILPMPGTLVDILADPGRNRIYVLRQDKNQVIVLDSVTLRQIGVMRTGNTPTTMALTEDRRYMIVGHDNSQFAGVHDLETLQASEPIHFPANYPATIAVGRNAIWATARPADGQPARLFKIDFLNRLATAPATLGIFRNAVPQTAALAASPSKNYIALGMTDGTVALWEADSDRWVVSRKDLTGIGGAFAALNDNLFAAGTNLLDESLFPVAALTTVGITPSGVVNLANGGLRIGAGAASSPGLIERLDFANRRAFAGTLLTEAPHVFTTLSTPKIGQIGQTILPFTRTLAVTSDESAIFLISQSGLTTLAPNFDAALTNPIIRSVVNSADGGAGIAPGGLITISGTGFATASATADGLPLPSTLGDVCVTAGLTALPLSRVSPTTISGQLPFNAGGAVPLVIRTPAGISAPFNINVSAGAPAIFRTGTAGDQSGLPLIIRNKNGEILNFTNPLHPGEALTIFLTGLGRVAPEPAPGDAAPADPLAVASFNPTVTIGDTLLTVDFAGLVPGQVGVYQINATVPAGIGDAAQTPLTVTQGTNSTTVPVRVVTP